MRIPLVSLVLLLLAGRASPLRAAMPVAGRASPLRVAMPVASNRAPHRAPAPNCAERANEYDVVVVGSGLGGLSAGALLAKYGERVLVCEAHSIAGGCAHSFERNGYTFDSGPSLWSGCAAPSTNPLRQVLDAVGESPDWVEYDGWCMYTEQGSWYAKVGDMASFKSLMARLGNGAETVTQWQRLLDFIAPLQTAVTSMPPLALRGDVGALLTATPYLGAMANPAIGLRAYLLSGPWSAVLDAAGVTDPWLLDWFDFLAFAFRRSARPPCLIFTTASQPHGTRAVGLSPTGPLPPRWCTCCTTCTATAQGWTTRSEARALSWTRLCAV